MKKLLSLLLFSFLLLGCVEQPATPTVTPTPVPTIEVTPTPLPTPIPASCDERKSLELNGVMDLRESNSSVVFKVLRSELPLQASFDLVEGEELLSSFSLEAGVKQSFDLFSVELISLNEGKADVCVNYLEPTPTPVSETPSLKVFAANVEIAAKNVLPEINFVEEQNKKNLDLSNFLASYYSNKYSYSISVSTSVVNKWPGMSTPVIMTGVNSEEKEVLYVILTSSSSSWKTVDMALECYGWKYYISANIKEYPNSETGYEEYAQKLMTNLISVCPG
ncbi:MAG: hypothetical protein ABH803_04535 [Candidatus Micrarchaeota archaeon]